MRVPKGYNPHHGASHYLQRSDLKRNEIKKVAAILLAYYIKTEALILSRERPIESTALGNSESEHKV